jgi:NADPH-dependent 2,4-dienoyl-CoA reductase/sulfur reductase-like enzyme
MFCAVNPMATMTTELRDGVIPRAPVKKKVAVIGGGPGGIQAMETLVARGHDVTLYEKSGSLGGNVIRAARPPFKIDMQDYLAWLRHTAVQCVAKGARVLLNTEAAKDALDVENYDAVVIAIGADPIIPGSIPGIHKPNAVWAPDAEEDTSRIGRKVVVVGGGGVGFETALECADLGKDVTLIEMLNEREAKMKLQMSAGSVSRELLSIFAKREIPVLYGTALAEVKDSSIVTKNMVTGELSELLCDTVLLAIGMKERWTLVEELRHCAPESNVHIVGDCRKVGTIAEAVNQAFQACIHI